MTWLDSGLSFVCSMRTCKPVICVFVVLNAICRSPFISVPFFRELHSDPYHPNPNPNIFQLVLFWYIFNNIFFPILSVAGKQCSIYHWTSWTGLPVERIPLVHTIASPRSYWIKHTNARSKCWGWINLCRATGVWRWLANVIQHALNI